MAERHPLLPLLACPRCVRARLDATKEGMRCRRCETEFPELDGIPWLFAHPAAAWDEWRGRYHFELRRLERDAEATDAALDGDALRASTRTRLEPMAAALRDQADRLGELMAPLALGSLETNHTTYLALRTRLPSDHGLHTYYANVHRDWCWGDAENRAAADLLAPWVEGAERVLVMGAGASRLAYDLHQSGSADTTVALDFNPMLLLLAQKMFVGESVDLYEFPIAPRRAEDGAVLHTLRAPEAARPGLEPVLGDVLRAPFAGDSFDVVLTPWLIDVVADEFPTLALRINHLLRDGGHWVNFGSLAFSRQNPSSNYGLDECLECVGEAGFGEAEVREETIPYMCSPHSRHGRREEVVAFRAQKREERKAPARYVALPDYLVTGEEPVPLLQSFQVQAMTTRIHAFMMTLIDGKRSIRDMAALMEEHKLMSREEAEARVRSFLIKMFEESERPLGL